VHGQSNWYLLAHLRKLRQCGHRFGVPGGWHWTAWGSLSFDLTVVTMAYAVGHISGCHLNPAVTVGLAAGGRFPGKDVGPYVIEQVVGAVVAAAVLYAIASGAPGFDVAKGFAANGYGEHSPGKYSLFAGLLAEIVLTMMFLFIIMGPTHGKAPAGDPDYQHLGQSRP
jgi:aquaporin Z